jgi:hypothetical protein
MNLAGIKGLVIDNYNSGSTGKPHLIVGNNSVGVIFNAPNFEQDAGTQEAGASLLRIGSGSEVTLNSPVFASPSAVSGGFLVRVVDTAVVTINHPQIIGEGAGIDNHLSVEGTAIVYLNDPKGVFTKVTVAATAQLIRVYDRLSTSPDFAQILSVSSDQVLATPKRALHASAEINTRIVGVYPASQALIRVVFDSYSGGSVRVRFIDTTTGLFVTGLTAVPLFIQWWYTELPL